ncbi:hypothetical protein Tagg_0045 [Thermosphaera aggregans DSM 11486]|jgi:positive regulator of sigma E activity|uniref:Uncharacterized protein n=2 Tax=Thermosphaera aggregans TaxID=54254 RepID=D5TZM7_THEAM|nr:hypothetical protein Tagg_0045 [Thermosphaera aggregans DSM 11486]
MKDRFRRELYSHLVEYDVVLEKARKYSMVLAGLLTVAVLGNWVYNIMNLQYFNPNSATQLIAISILYSSLILFSAVIGFILPHFSIYVRPRVFKELKDERIRVLLQTSMLMILSITLAVTFFIAYSFYTQVI